MHYINEDGAYDVAAIMREAHRLTRLDMNDKGIAAHSRIRYAFWFKGALAYVWQVARVNHWGYQTGQRRAA